ncbi:MAG: cell envelope integrity protein TolA [Pseudomonadota bacterium]
MMHWLLKHEGYPPSVLAALFLHGLLLWFIFDRDIDPKEMIEIKQPTIVASTVSENPQRTRRVETLELQRKQEQQRQARDRELQRERVQQQEREKQEVVRKETAEKERVAQQKKQQEQEQNRKQQADKERLAKEQQQKQETERQQKAAQEQAQRDAKLAEQQAAIQQALTEEEQLVAQYAAIIKDLIAQNWQLPPNARNGVRAVVELRVTPTGEIISKNIIESSGDPLFDRSVLQAVERAENFPELKELPIAVFERNFRQFSLSFQPEDLLR